MDIDYSSFLPQVLAKLFPGEDQRDVVVRVLGAYGREDFHLEVPRVHLGILKLSGSDIEKIKKWTAVACSDFRELLVDAEYRYSFGKGKLKDKDPEKYAKLERKEQEEYRQWLVKVLTA